MLLIQIVPDSPSAASTGVASGVATGAAGGSSGGGSSGGSSSQPSSPLFHVGRISSNSSSSSSSLSECPLESEILKSFADAQQLPRQWFSTPLFPLPPIFEQFLKLSFSIIGISLFFQLYSSAFFELVFTRLKVDTEKVKRELWESNRTRSILVKSFFFSIMY